MIFLIFLNLWVSFHEPLVPLFKTLIRRDDLCPFFCHATCLSLTIPSRPTFLVSQHLLLPHSFCPRLNSTGVLTGCAIMTFLPTDPAPITTAGRHHSRNPVKHWFATLGTVCIDLFIVFPTSARCDLSLIAPLTKRMFIPTDYHKTIGDIIIADRAVITAHLFF
jgi:hypothetical protein